VRRRCPAWTRPAQRERRSLRRAFSVIHPG
jgi:hypothetical protein